jgi:peptidoglycan/LPS O-acetylase OafA/YrhL
MIAEAVTQTYQPRVSAIVRVGQARLSVIDGIRGWAALVVVLYHLFVETFGRLFPVFTSSWTYFALNGPLAVTVFFILSGDAVSVSFFRSRQTDSIDRLLVKRYLRLAAPVLCSCLLIYCLMALGLTFNRGAGRVVRHDDWLGSFLTFAPNLRQMVRYALVGVFSKTGLETSYNPFLWTMPIELVGSVLVFLYLYVFNNLRAPITTLLGFIAVFFASRLSVAALFIGVYLGYLRASGVLDRLHRAPRWQAASALLVLALVVADTKLRYARIDPFWFNVPIASALIFCAYSNRALNGFFENKFSAALGRLSFPLYLCHFSIIVSLTSYLIVAESLRGCLSLGTALLVIAASLVAILAESTAFLLCEHWTLTVCDAFARRVLRR